MFKEETFAKKEYKNVENKRVPSKYDRIKSKAAILVPDKRKFKGQRRNHILVESKHSRAHVACSHSASKKYKLALGITWWETDKLIILLGSFTIKKNHRVKMKPSKMNRLSTEENYLWYRRCGYFN